MFKARKYKDLIVLKPLLAAMTILEKIYYLKKHFPDISLFIQTNPAFCCAGLVTEAMQKQIEQITGVPVVSITYDGTGGNRTKQLFPI